MQAAQAAQETTCTSLSALFIEIVHFAPGFCYVLLVSAFEPGHAADSVYMARETIKGPSLYKTMLPQDQGILH